MTDHDMIVTDVRKLLESVHRPVDEPIIPRGVSEHALKDFEVRTGIHVPAMLRSWLYLTNGPCVGEGGVFGVGTKRKYLDIEKVLELYPMWRQSGWIPIASDGFGNYYVVVSRNDFGEGEPVIFIETIADPAVPRYIVASDVWTFLRFMFRSELGLSEWPFDEHEVLREDPDIARFRGVPLPWRLCD